MGSEMCIRDRHIDSFHRASHDGILNWWQQQGATLDVKTLTDYDPYLRKVSNPGG